MTKKILFGLVIVLSIYYLSFIILGRNSLNNQILIDSNSSYHEYKWTNSIKLLSNLDIDDNYTSNVLQLLENNQTQITYINSYDISVLENHFYKNGSYNYLITSKTNHYPFVIISESEKIEEYVATWQKEYIWFFYKWIRTNDQMTGIS